MMPNRKFTIQDIMSEVRSSGMTPEELFYKKAGEQNANIDSILQQARMMASNFR